LKEAVEEEINLMQLKIHKCFAWLHKGLGGENYSVALRRVYPTDHALQTRFPIEWTSKRKYD